MVELAANAGNRVGVSKALNPSFPAAHAISRAVPDFRNEHHRDSAERNSGNGRGDGIKAIEAVRIRVVFVDGPILAGAALGGTPNPTPNDYPTTWVGDTARTVPPRSRTANRARSWSF